MFHPLIDYNIVEVHTMKCVINSFKLVYGQLQLTELDCIILRRVTRIIILCLGVFYFYF